MLGALTLTPMRALTLTLTFITLTLIQPWTPSHHPDRDSDPDPDRGCRYHFDSSLADVALASLAATALCLLFRPLFTLALILTHD